MASVSEITVESITAAGVVGAGGAGFPTAVKLSAEADAVILNAAECEPLLHKDKQLLRHFTGEVFAGLAAAMRLVGASRGFVGIKGKYAGLIEHIRPALPGGVEIAPLADAYPAGDEMILVYEVLGRNYPPGGIPLNVGAVVINVETALNVSQAPERPVTEKFLTVGGAVAEPATLRVPVGTPMSACVAAAGGPTCRPANYVVGGAMMGYIEEDHDSPVLKTTGGILVLPDDHVVVRSRRRDWKQIARIARSACDQCSFCTELCPRWLLGHPIEPHRAMRSLGFEPTGRANTPGTSFCCECNLCSMYSCPEGLDPKSVCAENKRRLASRGERWHEPPFDPQRADLHISDRRAPTGRLMQKLALTGFVNGGELKEEPLRVESVEIALKQHVGSPCEPTVSVGQKVRTGDVVGRPPEKDGKPALGAAVHASIDGTVTAIDEKTVRIEKSPSR
ncbi:MAG: SLBB domain-containing protein, partial [Planctomycetes bacterium]|nr:SLBB domain-containing protein [Planctomycetota bacterium]